MSPRDCAPSPARHKRGLKLRAEAVGEGELPGGSARKTRTWRGFLPGCFDRPRREGDGQGATIPFRPSMRAWGRLNPVSSVVLMPSALRRARALPRTARRRPRVTCRPCRRRRRRRGRARLERSCKRIAGERWSLYGLFSGVDPWVFVNKPMLHSLITHGTNLVPRATL